MSGVTTTGFTVASLIEALGQFDPDAEVHILDEDGWWTATDQLSGAWPHWAKYGLLTSNPKTVETVVLTRGSEGL